MRGPGLDSPFGAYERAVEETMEIRELARLMESVEEEE